MPAQSDPLAGRVIDGRYEILSRIARGGMATVYLGRDRRLDREVAVKIMHAHLAEGTSGADFVARFRREARSAARLDHPGLVAVLDQGVDGELSYLVMEYVDGSDLRRRLRAEGSLTVRDALMTAEMVLDALASAHQSGFVHRDIKPENVLLAKRGRIKVADFGLARAVTEVTAATTGSLLGTVAYLAPELVSHGISDTRTDVYAVGILLYEMLTGRQPYSGDSAIHIAYQHVHARVPAPSDLVAWLPAEIDDLVASLTAREVDERPENADHALALLRTTQAALDEQTLDRRADVTPAAVVEHAVDAPEPGPVVPPAAPAEVDPDATITLPAQRGPEPVPEEGPDVLGRTISLKIGSGLVDPRSRRRRVIGFSALVVLLTALIVVGISWFMTTGPGAYTHVPPSVVGATLADASATLDRAGLGVTSTQAFDPTIAKGEVVSATPEEGARIRKDGSVAIVVSKGPDMRTVPADLAGAKLEDALAALKAAGFTPETKHAYDRIVAEGIVVTVDPPSGDSQPLGTTVTVTVSDGPEPVTIISVVGEEAAQAKKDLESIGLLVTETKDYSTDFPAGQVMKQDPAPATPAHANDTVTITVSQGPPLVEVPKITYGASVKDATKILEKAGFVVKIEENRPFLHLNAVVRQSPDGGTQAPLGSTVILTIA